MASLDNLSMKALSIAESAAELSHDLKNTMLENEGNLVVGVDPFIFAITIFVLSCFIGYYVIWKVTPALHTPLMSVTNAISAIIIVGALLATSSETSNTAVVFGFIATMIAAINLFGGFVITHRMLQMFRKK